MDMDAAFARLGIGVTRANPSRSMKLHMVRGRFSTANAEAADRDNAGGTAAADSEAGATTDGAADKVTPAAGPVPVPAIACVTPGRYHDGRSKLAVVEVDLDGLVPPGFWKTDGYTVAAAGAGLVCISNNKERNYWAQRMAPVTFSCPHCSSTTPHTHPALLDKDPDSYVAALACAQVRDYIAREQFRNEFCVIDPAARTCWVLPPLPFPTDPAGWLPPTAAEAGAGVVACFGYVSEEAREAEDLSVATCHLAAAGGGDGGASASGPRWEVAKCETVGRRYSPWTATVPDVAVCAGRTYLYYRNGGGPGALVHVLTPRGRGRLVEVDAVGEPAVMRAALGAHAGETARRLAQTRFRGGAMVAARASGTDGDVYFVKTRGAETDVAGPDTAAVVWRLSRPRNVWVYVARLTVAELERLTAPPPPPPPAGVEEDDWEDWPDCGDGGGIWLCAWSLRLLGASGVRELVCCHVALKNGRELMLGFNLDTTQWGACPR